MILASADDWRRELNALENWFCSTGFWQRITRDHLLPWVVAGTALGDHVLELGAGPGAGTAALQRLAPRVTSLEWSHAFAVRSPPKTETLSCKPMLRRFHSQMEPSLPPSPS